MENARKKRQATKSTQEALPHAPLHMTTVNIIIPIEEKKQ